MNLQQLVDRVFAQAAKKQKSYLGKTYECRYRGDGGNMCFVGACISDAAYVPSIEGKPVEMLLQYEPHILPIDETGSMRSACVAWLVDAQEVHDRHQPHEWDEALRECLHGIVRRFDACVVEPPAVDEDGA